MPTSSTATLALAERLRSLSDAELTELVTLREVRDSHLRDYFDLADALLDSDSIQKAFTRLDRGVVAAISSIGAGATAGTGAGGNVGAPDTSISEDALHRASTLALIAHTPSGWSAYQPVIDQLDAWPTLGLPSRDELISAAPPATLAPVSPTDARFVDHIAAERAFATTNAVAELLAEVQREPARELARGGIALPDTKRLASAMGVGLVDVPALVEIAARAGLAALDSGEWLATAAASEWMLPANGDRWAHLADGWFQRLPEEIRSLLGERAHATWGDGLIDYVRWLYPAGGEWMRDRSAATARDAELLGITANQVPSTPGSALLSQGQAAATAAMTLLFPTEIDRVYVQHDLSIVSPGPLLPRLDARLRVFADVESRALATSYRVSQSSINRALALGQTAASIREFLNEISLTGIPQPLEYLIAGSEARFGSLRVGTISQPTTAANEQGARTFVTAEDPSLLAAVLVDHGLGHLGLGRVAPLRAVSRFDREVVFWALSEAKYPVAAEDAEGRILLLDRRRVAHPVSSLGESPATALVRRLRLAGETTPAETGRAWLERQIETAIRGKVALTVTIAMPDGSSVDLQLEPASLAGGRLRARDRRSDLERTLPLSSITAVAPAE